MSEQITIRKDQYNRIKEVRDNNPGISWSDALEVLIKCNNLQEAKIDEYGKVSISRTLKGKTILYKIKE